MSTTVTMTLDEVKKSLLYQRNGRLKSKISRMRTFPIVLFRRKKNLNSIDHGMRYILVAMLLIK